jgi:hypothetical protein
MAYESFLLGAIAVGLAYFGSEILARIPKQSRHSSFDFEICEHSVLFKLQTVIERDFEVAFVDGWSVGRPFSLHGTVMPIEDAREDGPNFGNRTGVYIYPSPDWFQHSRIGYVRTFEKGGCECRITLPYQIARHLLDDVRRDPNQFVSIGFKKAAGKNGETTYPIYRLELSESLD